MFSKSSKPKAPAGSQGGPVEKQAPPSIISVDLKIIGDLNSDGEIQIDGAVVGDIRTKSLLVGQSANIKGEIIADRIRVHGTVNGQIRARRVELAKSAHVVGDIMHEDLSIETGAFLEGLCKHVSGAELAESSKLNLVQVPGPDTQGKVPLSGNDAKKVVGGS